MPTKTAPKTAKPPAVDPKPIPTVFQTVTIFSAGQTAICHERKTVTIIAAANAAALATGSTDARCADVLSRSRSISQTVDIGRLRVTVRWSDH